MLAQKCHPADSKPLYFKQCCKGCLLLLPAILPTSQHLLSAAGCNAACNLTCEWASRSLNPPSHTIHGSKPAHWWTRQCAMQSTIPAYVPPPNPDLSQ